MGLSTWTTIFCVHSKYFRVKSLKCPKICLRGLWMAHYVHITLLHIYIGPSFESVAQLSCQVVGKLFGCTFPPFLPTYICTM